MLGKIEHSKVNYPYYSPHISTDQCCLTQFAHLNQCRFPHQILTGYDVIMVLLILISIILVQLPILKACKCVFPMYVCVYVCVCALVCVRAHVCVYHARRDVLQYYTKLIDISVLTSKYILNLRKMYYVRA